MNYLNKLIMKILNIQDALKQNPKQVQLI